jgi:hypothetical protein
MLIKSFVFYSNSQFIESIVLLLFSRASYLLWKIVSAGYWGGGAGGGGVGGKGGGGGRGEKWTKPCMHVWIIKEKKKDWNCLFLINLLKVTNKKKKKERKTRFLQLMNHE